MDNHHGKYQGPLAALTERWVLEGFHPADVEWSNSDIGEGTMLWRGLHELTYEESKWLRSEFECTDDDLDVLVMEMHAAGLAHSWDSRGFIYAWPLDTMEQVEALTATLNGQNEEENDDTA